MQDTRSAFLSGLLADGPVAGRRDAMMLYGWLVGSWQATRIDHLSDGSTHEEDAEIHANWILEGRAVQDVWISPRPGRGNPGETPANGVHGTTLRIYDPSADNWRIVWAHPSTGDVSTMIGRRVGHDIVQWGVGSDGLPMRWSFTEIEADAFHWLGEREIAPGDWRMRREYRARRLA